MFLAILSNIGGKFELISEVQIDFHWAILPFPIPFFYDLEFIFKTAYSCFSFQRSQNVLIEFMSFEITTGQYQVAEGRYYYACAPDGVQWS